MTNAELFKKIFGIYAEGFWAYSKEEMLDWLNSNVLETNTEILVSKRAAIEAISQECGEFRGIFKRCENSILALPSTSHWIPCPAPAPDKGEDNA